MSDRKIAKAAHPVIHAWRCEVNGVMHQDNDDDGETAAGSRLAHLLQILVRLGGVNGERILTTLVRDSPMCWLWLLDISEGSIWVQIDSSISIL